MRNIPENEKQFLAVGFIPALQKPYANKPPKPDRAETIMQSTPRIKLSRFGLPSMSMDLA